MCEFEIAPFEELDQLALLACQSYNIGNERDWFGEFRAALYALYSRLNGIGVHYQRLFGPGFLGVDGEYHMATLFFQMDSALECLVFALNALGWGIEPDSFKNPKQESSAGDIRLTDLTGGFGTKGTKTPCQGFTNLFPQAAALWSREKELIGWVRDLHDVSKHRKIVMYSGEGRKPTDREQQLLRQAVNTSPEAAARLLAALPSQFLTLQVPLHPKRPRMPSDPFEPHGRLEDLMPRYARFINETGKNALEDARACISLKEKQFRSK